MRNIIFGFMTLGYVASYGMIIDSAKEYVTKYDLELRNSNGSGIDVKVDYDKTASNNKQVLHYNDQWSSDDEINVIEAIQSKLDPLSHDAEILSAVEKYVEKDQNNINALKFNNHWNEMLLSILNNKIAVLDKAYLKELELWCEVTNNVICNYDLFVFPKKYCRTLYDQLKQAVDILTGIKNDKIRKLGDFLLWSVSMLCSLD